MCWRPFATLIYFVAHLTPRCIIASTRTHQHECFHQRGVSFLVGYVMEIVWTDFERKKPTCCVCVAAAVRPSLVLCSFSFGFDSGSATWAT
jgi:hypothetical protein